MSMHSNLALAQEQIAIARVEIAHGIAHARRTMFGGSVDVEHFALLCDAIEEYLTAEALIAAAVDA